MPSYMTAEKKPASGASQTAPAPAVSSTRRVAGRQAPVYSGVNPSTLLPGAPASAPQVSAKVAADEIDLSKGTLAILSDVAESVKEGTELDVKVRLPGLAQGDLRLRRRGNKFSSMRDQGILLSHPALARFSGANPTVLVLHVVDDEVTGWVGVGTPGPVKGGPRSLSDVMKKSEDLLGWAGLSKITIPTFHNQFASGVIDVRAENLAFTVGGFLSGSGGAALDNKALSFDGSAKIQIPPSSGGELQIKKDPTGALSGRLDLQVSVGRVAGTVTATLTRGFVSIMGSVGYTDERMSGKVTLVATDEATARDVTLKKPEAGGDVPIELPGPDKPVKPGKRAYCGWGRITFHVTEWLAGTATVIVNSKGEATIIGEIAPPKEFILFEQKEWVKRIFKVEIRAGYGIPVVGQVALFANISLDAIAKIGPGKLYNIKLSGTYSTDRRVSKQLTIEATLNISAFAGLRARAEAGLVVTILAHDIKAGVGLDAIAGVRGYVEATPRIGMRELQPGKRQYFIQGHLEIAAQPVLGFSGELFVELETPWWSPLSDKRWTWPLFSLEYPLPGEFGIGADVDYVLGSKQWPNVEFGEVNFDGSKFLTDIMNDNAESGHGGEVKKKGEWQEGLGGGGPGGARNKGGSGKKPGELGADSDPVGESLTFSDGTESHRLWFEERPGAAVLMVATKQQTVPERLMELKGRVKYLREPDRAKAEALIARAQAQLPKVRDEAAQVAAMKEAERKAEETYRKYGKDKKKSKGKKPSRKDKNKQLKTDEKKLEEALQDLFSQMRSMEIKAKVKADLSGKLITSEAAEEALISSVFSRYNKDGLKGISFQPSKRQRRIVDVLVSASDTERVEQLRIWTPMGIEELEMLAGRMHMFATRTTIFIFYGTDNTPFGSVSQKAGGKPGHAEVQLLHDAFPRLLERIRRERARKILKAIDKGAIPIFMQPTRIFMQVTRTPCDGCATSHLLTLLESMKAAEEKEGLRFKLIIASSFKSEGPSLSRHVPKGAHGTTPERLAGFLQKADELGQDVTLTSSSLWATIEQKMREQGVPQFDYRQRTFTIDDAREFRVRAEEVQDLIDRAVKLFNRAKRLERTQKDKGKK